MNPVAPIPRACSPPQRRIAVASDHDWDATIADRLGVDPDRIEADERPVERRDIVTPQRTHRGDVFGRARRAMFERYPERGEFLSGPPAAHPERQPPTAEPIQARGLLGDHDRAVFG